jgi:hypothetical protein
MYLARLPKIFNYYLLQNTETLLLIVGGKKMKIFFKSRLNFKLTKLVNNGRLAHRHHDAQYNDTQHDDNQHNNSQHNDTITLVITTLTMMYS